MMTGKRETQNVPIAACGAPSARPGGSGSAGPAGRRRQRASRAWEADGGASQGVDRFVGFRVGRRHYALPLDCVSRVLRMVAVTPVPEAPSWVAGAINLHGQVVPAVDLRQRLGEPPRAPTPSDRLLVVEILGRTTAFIVDETTEVLAAPAQQTGPPPEPLPQSDLLAAVIRWREELVLVLDAARLLPKAAEIAACEAPSAE